MPAERYLKILCNDGNVRHRVRRRTRFEPPVEPKKMIPIAAAPADIHKAQLKAQMSQMRGDAALVTLVGEKKETWPSPVVYQPVSRTANQIPILSMSQPLPATGSILMNQTNALAVAQIRRVAESPLYWHKFSIVRGAGYDRRDLLRAVMTAVQPLPIAPVMFRQDGGNVSFLLKNCLPVIEKFINCNFRISVPCNGPKGAESHELDMEMTLRYTHVQELGINPSDFLRSAILRRYDKTLKSFDLSAFADDEELSSTVLWPLWPPSAMPKVLKTIESFCNTIEMVNLANNNLRNLGYLTSLPNLRILDVSGNHLSNVSVLKPLKNLPIVDLNLDGNPLCSAFSDEKKYISSVKAMVPAVKKLDGVYLPRRPDMPCRRQNYIPPDHRAECTALVDQFLQHFFTLLDGDDRTRLRGMYHPYALFSLTCVEGPVKGLILSSKLAPYTSQSRNLLRISDYSKMQQLLREGSDEVLAVLCRLPATEHDPYSFAVDVPFFSNDAAVIVVHGVFREPPNIKDVRAFSRLFILRKVAENEYQIANEMLSIGKATPNQVVGSFRHVKPKETLARLSFNPTQDLNNADRDQMTKILSRITEMNPRWAAKCLEESKWDIKNALQVFSELIKANKIPAEAFLPEKGKSK